MLDALLKQLGERLNMTPEQALEQVIRFAYANAKLENPDITMEMIREAALVDDVRG